MALSGKINKEEGKEDVFVAEFTNGTLKQLEELAVFLEGEGIQLSKEGAERMKEVVRFGIAWLETLKEEKEKTDKPKV